MGRRAAVAVGAVRGAGTGPGREWRPLPDHRSLRSGDHLPRHPARRRQLSRLHVVGEEPRAAVALRCIGTPHRHHRSGIEAAGDADLRRLRQLPGGRGQRHRRRPRGDALPHHRLGWAAHRHPLRHARRAPGDRPGGRRCAGRRREPLTDRHRLRPGRPPRARSLAACQRRDRLGRAAGNRARRRRRGRGALINYLRRPGQGGINHPAGRDPLRCAGHGAQGRPAGIRVSRGRPPGCEPARTRAAHLELHREPADHAHHPHRRFGGAHHRDRLGHGWPGADAGDCPGRDDHPLWLRPHGPPDAGHRPERRPGIGRSPPCVVSVRHTGVEGLAGHPRADRGAAGHLLAGRHLPGDARRRFGGPADQWPRARIARTPLAGEPRWPGCVLGQARGRDRGARGRHPADHQPGGVIAVVDRRPAVPHGVSTATGPAVEEARRSAAGAA